MHGRPAAARSRSRARSGACQWRRAPARRLHEQTGRAATVWCAEGHRWSSAEVRLQAHHHPRCAGRKRMAAPGSTTAIASGQATRAQLGRSQVVGTHAAGIATTCCQPPLPHDVRTACGCLGAPAEPRSARQSGAAACRRTLRGCRHQLGQCGSLSRRPTTPHPPTARRNAGNQGQAARWAARWAAAAAQCCRLPSLWPRSPPPQPTALLVLSTFAATRCSATCQPSSKQEPVGVRQVLEQRQLRLQLVHHP